MDLPERVEAWVRGQVGIGEYNCPEIVDEAIGSVFVGEPDTEQLRRMVLAAAGAAFAAHLADQVTWAPVTDNDRVTAAFRGLDEAGIVAREAFTQTITDGRHAIRSAAGDGAAVRGFAFYHEQDREHCVAGGGLSIAYGGFDDHATADIGREVAAALRAQELTIDWDGDDRTRIQVAMRWQRRRQGRMAAAPPFPLPADDIIVNVDRWDWVGATEPPRGRQSAAEFAGAYLPWMPKGARVSVFAELSSVDIGWDGDDLVGELTYMHFPDRSDSEPLIRTLDAVRLRPDQGWDLLRRLSDRVFSDGVPVEGP